MKSIDLEKIKNNYSKDYLITLEELVKIPSICYEKENNMPFGKACDDALNYAIDFCKNIGANVVYKDIENYYVYADFGEGDEILGILCHLDVVELGDLSRWNKEPFIPTIEGEYMYGRGASDTKGPVVDVLYAIKYLKDIDYNFNKNKIRFVFGINEEYFMASLLKYKKDFGDFTLGSIVTEPSPSLILKQKGKVGYKLVGKLDPKVKLYGGRDLNIICDKLNIEFSDKKIQDQFLSEIKKTSLKIEIKENTVSVLGRPGHGSMPEIGVNAINKACKIFEKINYKENDIINWVNDFARDGYYLEHIFGSKEDETGKLTINIGYIKNESDTQVVGCDIRVNPSNKNDYVVEKSKEYANKHHLIYKEVFNINPVDHTDNDFTRSILTLVEKYQPEHINTYNYTGGVSYSNLFKNSYTIGVDIDHRLHIKEIIQNKGDFLPHSFNERYFIKNPENRIAFYVESIFKFLSENNY